MTMQSVASNAVCFLSRSGIPARPDRAGTDDLLRPGGVNTNDALHGSLCRSPGADQAPGGKNGIALVLVLGMLALMTILAVSFTISMRVERLAAGAQADIVRSRQLMTVARERVLEDVDRSMGLWTREAFTVSGGFGVGRLRVSGQYDYIDDMRAFVEDTGNLPDNISTGVLYYIEEHGDELGLKITPGGGEIDVNPGSGIVRVLTMQRQRATMVDTNDNWIHVPNIDAFDDDDVVFIDSTGLLVNLERNHPYRIKEHDTVRDRFRLRELSVATTIELECGDGALFVTRYGGWEDFDSEAYPISETESIRRLIVGKPIMTGTEIMFRDGYLPANEYEICYAIRVNDTNIDVAASYSDAIEGKRIALDPGDNYNGQLAIKPSVYPPWDAATSFSDNNVHAGGVFAVDAFTNDPGRQPFTIFPVNQTYVFNEDDCVYLDSTGTLPAGFNLDTPYYVTPVYTNCGMKLSLTVGGAWVPCVNQGSGEHSVRFVDREAIQNAPDALWESASDQEAFALTNYWIPLTTVIDTNNTIMLMGMYGYNILNCSGLIDINAAGLDSARAGGTNPLELALAYLNEVSDVNAVRNARTAYTRFETIDELAELGALNSIPEYLFTYSHNLPGFWSSEDAFDTSIIQLGLTDPLDLLPIENRRAEIMNAFHLCGFTNEGSADTCYNNLIDYLDDDSVPENFTNSVEAVPMINEVCITNFFVSIDGLTPGKKTYRNSIAVYVEVRYPFLNSHADSYYLSCTPAFTPLVGADPAPDPAFMPDVPIAPVPVVFDVSAPQNFWIQPLYFKTDETRVELNDVDPVSSIYYGMTLNLEIKHQGDDVVVDRLETPFAFEFNNDTPNVARRTMYAGKQCLDPRFNYCTDTPFWQDAPAPIDPLTSFSIDGLATAPPVPVGEENLCTVDYWANNPDCDGEPYMYVRNEPMTSVGELGYLVYSTNAPWRTIKIYGTNADFEALGRFAVTNNPPAKGLVNPNTQFTNVMATVFYQMPVDRYPGDVPSTVLDPNQAKSLAGEVMRGRPCMNPGEAFAFLNEFPIGGLSEFEKESFVRNSIGLFSTRQNCFAVFVRADAANSGNMAKSPVRETGMAVIWRDPFTGESFIRQYKPIGQ